MSRRKRKCFGKQLITLYHMRLRVTGSGRNREMERKRERREGGVRAQAAEAP